MTITTTLSYRELAESTGINAQHIARVLQGKASISLIHGQKLATALGLTVDQLWAELDQPASKRSSTRQGQNDNRPKLNQDKAERIRYQWDSGHYTLRQLAAVWEVSAQAISDVIKGRSYK